ncbi:MAG: alpha/beta hydrolase [Tahibacter sp.]
MKRAMWYAATTAVLLYVGLCIALFCYQRSLIYFPQARAFATPETTQHLRVADADLELSVRPRAGARALIYFGGNGEDVSASLAGFSAAFPEHSLYLMHYRGFAGSSGSPTEAALHADALALFDLVYATHADVVVIGRSLGSGVAVHLASERPASRLVLVTPYNSLLELAEQQVSYVPVRWLLQDRFESWRYAPRVSAATDILVAGNDEVIPAESSRLLFSRFRDGIASYSVINDVGHNSIASSSDYLKALAHVRADRPPGIPAEDALTRANAADIAAATRWAGDPQLQRAIQMRLGDGSPRWSIAAAREQGDYVLLWIRFPDVDDGGIDLVYTKSQQRIGWEFNGGERG